MAVRFQSLRSKLRLAMAGIGIILSLISAFLMYSAQMGAIESGFALRLQAATNLAKSHLDIDSCKILPLEQEGTKHAFYPQTLNRLVTINEQLQLAYVYLMVPAPDSGWLYVFDTQDSLFSPDVESSLGKRYALPPPEIAQAYQSGKPVHTPDYYTDETGTFKSLFTPIYDSNGKIWGVLGVDIEASQVKKVQWNALRTMLVLLFVTAILTLFGAWIARMLVVKPVEKLRDSIQELSQSKADLSRRLLLHSQDETGQTSHFLNQFLERLQAIFAQVRHASGHVDTASVALDSVSGRLSQDTRKLSAMVGELATSTESVSQSMQTITESIGQLDHSVQSGAGAVEELSITLRNVSHLAQEQSSTAQDVNQQTQRASDVLESLQQAAHNIGSVLDIIRAVADQTRLLALNATIEAARAGEAGKGFAVVAGEVKELASKTALATANVDTQVHEIRTRASEAKRTLEKISQSIEAVSIRSETLAAAVEEQTVAVSEIARNMGESQASSSTIASAVKTTNSAVAMVSERLTQAAEVGQSSHQIAAQVQEQAAQLAKSAQELKQVLGEFAS